MRRHFNCLLFLIVLAATLSLTSCATQSPASASQPSLLVMLRIAGGGTPSPAVVARFHQSLADPMNRAGLRFAQNMDEANYILSATFTPDPANPDQGQFNIHKITKNFRANSRDDLRQQMNRQIQELQSWAESKAAPMTYE